MKFFILVCLIFSSPDSFLLSPMAKAHLGDYNDAVEKLEYPMKEIMPEVYDYFSKMHQVMKKVAEKTDKKLHVSSKSIENGDYTTESHITSNIVNGKENLSLINDQREKEFSEEKTKKIVIKNHFNRDFGNHTPATVFNIPEISTENFIIKSIERSSDNKHILNITDNKHEFNARTHANSFSQKEIEDKGNRSGTSNIAAVVNSKNGYQMHHKNRKIFEKFSTGVNNKIKRSIIGNNTEKGLHKNQSSKISNTNDLHLKNNRELNVYDPNVAKISKPEFINEKGNRHDANKASISTKAYSENYEKNSVQKIELSTLVVGLISQEETHKMRSEKSKTETPAVNEERSDDKNSPVISGIDRSNQLEIKSKKEIRQNLEKIKFIVGEDKEMSEKDMKKKIPTSTKFFTDPDVKATKSDKMQLKQKEFPNFFSLSTEASIHHDSKKFLTIPAAGDKLL